MYQLLKATKYLHSGNVIHRDHKVPIVWLSSILRVGKKQHVQLKEIE